MELLRECVERCDECVELYQEYEWSVHNVQNSVDNE